MKMMSTEMQPHTPQTTEIASCFDFFVARFTATHGRAPTARDAFEEGVSATPRVLRASADCADAHQKQPLAAVKAALLQGVRAYLRRASSGGMPSKDVATVEAVVSGVMELGYLEAALQAQATEVAALRDQCAFDEAYRALRSCKVLDAEGTCQQQFDEALVHRALYDLAVIRARIRLGTSHAQTNVDGA